MTDHTQIIRKNRKTLRKAGATTLTLLIVETYFSMKKKNARVSLAAVGRVLGFDRSQVSRHMTRASSIYLVFKVGREFRLNVKSLLKWAADGIAQRAQNAKRLFLGIKSKSGDNGSPHTGPKIKKEPSQSQMRQQATAIAGLSRLDRTNHWLAAMGEPLDTA